MAVTTSIIHHAGSTISLNVTQTKTSKMTSARRNSTDRKTVLYLSASQFSGSTLVSFLLNSHPKVTTVGHTMGWHFASDEDFYCSCGALIDQCSFFQFIAKAYSERGLKFDVRDFGTEVRVSTNDRINRYLTASLPLVQNSALELRRDRLVSESNKYAATIERQLLANDVFMSTAMLYSNAEIYVDNSHDPYRLRFLDRINAFDLKNIHLVRDPRGFALSCKKHTNWSPALATRLWIRRQSDIFRIGDELATPSHSVFYEDLCTDTDETLAKIYRFGNVDPMPFDGAFNHSEHHILGNAMRLRGGSIQLDERWRRELTPADLGIISSTLRKSISKSTDSRLNNLVRHYLNDERRSESQ